MANKESKQMSATSNHSKYSVALTAVALQDHWSKYLKLNDPIDKFKRKQSTASKRSEIKKKKPLVEVNVEFVLLDSNKTPKWSLAEKYGLIDTNKFPKLSEEDWLIIKKIAEERNFFEAPCPICMDVYNSSRQEVLLSCSHVFHRQCISSFEKFSGRIICPVCREANYLKRVVFDGTKATRNRCATIIQKHWHKYIACKKYQNFRKNIPPNDKKLRKKYYKEKFFKISKTFHDSQAKHQNNVEQLIQSIDSNLSTSKCIMKNFDAVRNVKKKSWCEIYETAIARGNKECAICLEDLLNSSVNNAILLSCTHVFHSRCLKSFESFLLKDEVRCCPVCRTAYVKYCS